jgi:hypothetical protein
MSALTIHDDLVDDDLGQAAIAGTGDLEDLLDHRHRRGVVGQRRGRGVRRQ